MANNLKIIYEKTDDQAVTCDTLDYRNKPFANSLVYEAFIEDFQPLTQGADVKRVYKVDLKLQNVVFDFLPGDVIGILPENDEIEVKELITRLSLEKVCYNKYELKDSSNKKSTAIPKHVPPSGTLYDLFLKHLDIRAPPKKLFLKKLIHHTTDPTERETLEKICSSSGSNAYTKLLSENRSLLSLLNAFPSCHPPIELILENSPPLNPRYFSIASSPLNTHQVSIIFDVLDIGKGLKGVCTGWLERTIKQDNFKSKAIPLYFRKPGNFRLTNVDIPLILIAAGTGLAPFMSFLEHKKLTHLNKAEMSLLFYGCRYSDRDFLCRNQLECYEREGVLTKLCPAFSREGDSKVYVQHRIVECKGEVMELIENKGAVVYVCGDGKTMVKDVKELFVKCFMECRGVDRGCAESVIGDFVEKGRFLVDSWL